MSVSGMFLLIKREYLKNFEMSASWNMKLTLQLEYEADIAIGMCG